MKILPDNNRTLWLLMLLTVIGAIAVYRIGFQHPVPAFDEEAVRLLQTSNP